MLAFPSGDFHLYHQPCIKDEIPVSNGADMLQTLLDPEGKD